MLLLVLLGACALASAARVDTPYASVTADDGTVHTFYRTSHTLSADEAAAMCAANGGKLAPLASKEQVDATWWKDSVVDAASKQPDIDPLWTGFRISWSGARHRHRRMLRATAASYSFSNPDFALDDSYTTLSRLLTKMESDPTAPPRTTADGRVIPQLVRVHMFEALLRKRRALAGAITSTNAVSGGRRSLHSVDGGGAKTSAFLKDAVVSFADGSDTDMVMANVGNIGFLACNKKKDCCGATFDVGRDAYGGADFPTVFMLPCDSTNFGSFQDVKGYACVVSPVAELPDGGTGSGKSPKPSPKPSPSPSPTPDCKPGAKNCAKCGPGFQPVTTAGHTQCKKCKPNTFSADGATCKKCPAGTKSSKGAATCKAP
ncbi:hypothetical protein GPECTOR_9g560 [Gonium pectorale]|uniref:C-type lectin domain-containing protein n=1 Tax=Gonium pectorale TaxID=33097 RepID=A0A150GRM3_GONPE|nr:hypothetical protein GPECTOR_9g560 [Gonium pectorale]|eukprot:KXZ52516.1 hypothetical protein GPECTOR_9g560 [Gonium pectorale]